MRYIGEKFHLLQGHILKYPIKVDDDGHVTPIYRRETFLDIGGKVLGAPRFYIPIKIVNKPLETMWDHNDFGWTKLGPSWQHLK